MLEFKWETYCEFLLVFWPSNTLLLSLSSILRMDFFLKFFICNKIFIAIEKTKYTKGVLWEWYNQAPKLQCSNISIRLKHVKVVFAFQILLCSTMPILRILSMDLVE